MSGLCFFFKQKTAYEMRISDWSSDVCSSDLEIDVDHRQQAIDRRAVGILAADHVVERVRALVDAGNAHLRLVRAVLARAEATRRTEHQQEARSEEHTSELQSLMRISYAVFCLKKKKTINKYPTSINHNNHY